jgi:four helix bundle protein
MYRQLEAYKLAYHQAMHIFELTKSFPIEERYSLIDQVRRSSRSVCVNISEGYRKRLYEKHFISKMSDSDMENSETRVWIDFAFTCKYLNQQQFDSLKELNQSIGRIISFMIHNPKKFQPKSMKQ